MRWMVTGLAVLALALAACGGGGGGGGEGKAGSGGVDGHGGGGPGGMGGGGTGGVEEPKAYGSIEGVAVLGEDPVEGFLIRIAGADRTATTDASGQFSFDEVEIGSHTILGTGAGYQDATAEVVVEEDKTAVVVLRLAEAPIDGERVRGTVLDEDGLPIADASVSVMEGPFTARTDTSGGWTLILSPGMWLLVIEADGFQPEFVAIQVVKGEELRADVTLVSQEPLPTGIVRGRVEDESAIPLAGVRLEVHGDPSTHTETDAGGQYELEMPSGDYTLRAELAGYHEGLINVSVTENNVSEPPPLVLNRHMVVDEVVPSAAVRGGWITVRGRGFGPAARPDVAVMVGGFQATDIASWSDEEILVRTPSDAPLGEVVVELSPFGETAGLVTLKTPGIRPVAGGVFHSLAIQADGTIVGWGAPDRVNAVPPGLTDVAAVAVGFFPSMALRSDGTVIAWTEPNSTLTWEVDVPDGLSNVIEISAGASHLLALRADGTVAAWGSNEQGQSAVPEGLASVQAIAAGGTFSLALRTDGTVVAWGEGYFGGHLVPEALDDVVGISASTETAYALRADGTLVSWGYQIGLPKPSTLGKLSRSFAGFHKLGIAVDGTVVGWGSDADSRASVPPELSGVSGVAHVAEGYNHSFAVLEDGSVVCWGGNVAGQATAPEGLVVRLTDELGGPSR